MKYVSGFYFFKLDDPLLTESISDDVDFLWYDLEHVLYDNSSINLHLLACRFKQTMSFVRLGDFTSGNIKNVLDAGANGIIAAQIKSYEEALIFSPPISRAPNEPVEVAEPLISPITSKATPGLSVFIPILSFCESITNISVPVSIDLNPHLYAAISS